MVTTGRARSSYALWRPRLPTTLLLLTFGLTLTARVWNIDEHFWLLRDQIRDWRIALGPFGELPLVGPATHVGGYTIGPAFYWILWTIRVLVGPWFDNLPHAGGIGQAALGSAADALLLLAVWRRTQSVWIAIAAITLLSTAAFDLSLAAVIWNPIMGATLATFATAMVLLGWHRRSLVWTGAVAAVAWSAVHAYTGAIYVTVSVLLVLIAEPLVRRDRTRFWRTTVAVLSAVVALQLPYIAFRLFYRTNPVMGAVSAGLGRILSGEEPPRIAASIEGYADAVNFIEAMPWQVPLAWALVPCGLLVAWRYRRDVALLSMTLLPQILTIAGYALFLGALDRYYYFSLMPAAVLTLMLGATALPWPSVSRAVAIALCGVAIAIVPARMRYATSMNQLPEYKPLVRGSRIMAGRRQPLRAIETTFSLPRTVDRTVIYEILGGRIDPTAPWIGRIDNDGAVTYRRADGS